MARPVKNNCDYFTHDRDMRNHRKIKALRTKFGINGYALWNMILEYLTGIDGNEFENSDVELELMAGDFGVSVTEISNVLDYCLKLELLFLKNGFINSESLDERLAPVYEKRKVAKCKSKKQLRINGKFSHNNYVSNGVSVTEMPQSKVKYSKVNNNNNNGSWNSQRNLFLNAEQWQYKQATEYRVSKEIILKYISEYLKLIELQEDYKDEKELKRHCANWLRKKIKPEVTAALEQKRILPEEYWQE